MSSSCDADQYAGRSTQRSSNEMEVGTFNASRDAGARVSATVPPYNGMME